MMRKPKVTPVESAEGTEGTPVIHLGWPETAAHSKVSPMMCHFCRQDVKAPCLDLQEMHERAMSHMERCENILRDNMSDRIHPGDGLSAGSL